MTCLTPNFGVGGKKKTNCLFKATVTLGFYCFQMKTIKTYTSDDTATGTYSLGYIEGTHGLILGIRGGCAWLQPAGCVDWVRQVGGAQGGVSGRRKSRGSLVCLGRHWVLQGSGDPLP